MRPIKINNPESVAAQIEEEIHKRPEGRYFHRLHIVLLLARGLSAQKVAELYGKSIRTVQRWAKAVNTHGLRGLMDNERPGPKGPGTDRCSPTTLKRDTASR